MIDFEWLYWKQKRDTVRLVDDKLRTDKQCRVCKKTIIFNADHVLDRIGRYCNKICKAKYLSSQKRMRKLQIRAEKKMAKENRVKKEFVKNIQPGQIFAKVVTKTFLRKMYCNK